MYRIRFDAFIHSVITSEPTIKEPIPVMQRFNFDNGYGEELLVTHIRILGRTFISETKHKKITMKTFQHLAKSYDNVCQHDLELAYSIISPEKDSHIWLHTFKKYFSTLTEKSISNIMKTLYKDYDNVQTVTYDLPFPGALTTDIPENQEKSISIMESPIQPVKTKTNLTQKSKRKQKKNRVSFCQKLCTLKCFHILQ